MKPLRLLVLASGRGSHAVNLIEATRAGRLPGEVTRVVCDQQDAPALEKAHGLGVPTSLLAPWAPGPRLHPDAESQLEAIARAEKPDVVALCGFMRLLRPEFLARVPAPVLNVHPSLLPSFRGLHAQRQALEAGVRVTGATVHFVDAGMDTGPILLQAALDVRPDDTEDSLSARLLPLEQRLYVDALRLMQLGAVHKEGRLVRVDAPALRSLEPAVSDRRK